MFEWFCFLTHLKPWRTVLCGPFPQRVTLGEVAGSCSLSFPHSVGLNCGQMLESSGEFLTNERRDSDLLGMWWDVGLEAQNPTGDFNTQQSSETVP
jgi:hypothetical protein